MSVQSIYRNANQSDLSSNLATDHNGIVESYAADGGWRMVAPNPEDLSSPEQGSSPGRESSDSTLNIVVNSSDLLLGLEIGNQTSVSVTSQSCCAHVQSISRKRRSSENLASCEGLEELIKKRRYFGRFDLPQPPGSFLHNLHANLSSIEPVLRTPGFESCEVGDRLSQLSLCICSLGVMFLEELRVYGVGPSQPPKRCENFMLELLGVGSKLDSLQRF